MEMLAFSERFGDLAFEETRVLTIPPGNVVPAGVYGLLEFYCPDDDCDCRRVIIMVVSEESGGQVWATLSYGWEGADFYRKWSPGIDNAPEWFGATLDPLNPQSVHCEAFLRLFKEVVLQDKSYVDRLKRHYTMFKNFSKSPKPPQRAKARKR
jgi:hypothetical protein